MHTLKKEFKEETGLACLTSKHFLNFSKESIFV